MTSYVSQKVEFLPSMLKELKKLLEIKFLIQKCLTENEEKEMLSRIVCAGNL